MLPLVGPRGLAAARAAGARVVLHLHNVRLFCAIGVAARDGGPCFRCHHRLTLPGLVLNCRGSLPEAAVYAAALALHQPAVLRRRRPLRGAEPLRRRAARAPGRAGRAARGAGALPPGRGVRRALRAHPRAATCWRPRGSREEKGLDVAIEAAAAAGVALKVAGEGPAAAALAGQVGRASVRRSSCSAASGASGSPSCCAGRRERSSCRRATTSSRPTRLLEAMARGRARGRDREWAACPS